MQMSVHTSRKLNGLAIRNHIPVQHRNTSVYSHWTWMFSSCYHLMTPQNLCLPQAAANCVNFLVSGLVLGIGIKTQSITKSRTVSNKWLRSCFMIWKWLQWRDFSLFWAVVWMASFWIKTLRCWSSVKWWNITSICSWCPPAEGICWRDEVKSCCTKETRITYITVLLQAFCMSLF